MGRSRDELAGSCGLLLRTRHLSVVAVSHFSGRPPAKLLPAEPVRGPFL